MNKYAWELRKLEMEVWGIFQDTTGILRFATYSLASCAQMLSWTEVYFGYCARATAWSASGAVGCDAAAAADTTVDADKEAAGVAAADAEKAKQVEMILRRLEA